MNKAEAPCDRLAGHNHGLRAAHLPTGLRLGPVKKIRECHPGAISIAPRGRSPRCHRRMIEAMIFKARTGCPWRDLPEIFGPWKSVCARWRRWNHLGLWDTVLRWLEPCAQGQLRCLDATHIKQHQDGANPAGGQGCKTSGRTKVGLNTKLTALVDGGGRAFQVRLDPGQRSDLRIAEAIVPPTGTRLIAGKGYDSDKLRTQFGRGGPRRGTPPRETRCGRVPIHRCSYRLRHRVENLFKRVNRFRAIASRYDKLSLHFLSTVQFVAMLEKICFRRALSV